MDVLALLRRAVAERYDVDRQIGAGGMALVFRARDIRHDRWVAIKLLQPELAASVGSQRFLREIAFAASLQHPNLLPVYDSGSAEGQLYYVMPFVEGQSLAARLTDSGPLPLGDVVAITRDVASALTFAHGRGIIHRDIKPDNILLIGTRAVVADLGIARALDQARQGALTGTGMAIGTAHYMSPEQALGDESAGAASDQYSLGCVVYEMLTGEQPFRAPSLPAVLAKVISAPRPRPSSKRADLPAAVDAVVTRALAADPAERYDSCDRFASALDEASRTTSAAPQAVSARGGLASPTRSVVMWGALAAAVLTLVALSIRGFRTPVPGDTPVRPAPVSETRIVIRPFTANVTSSAVLADGMVDLVAANLSDIAGVTVVPGVADSTVASGVRSTAGRSGRDALVTGSLFTLGAQTRLVARIARPDGVEIARVQFEGAEAATLSLVDSMSVAILRAVWGKDRSAPTGRTGALTTASMPAVHAFLAGQQAARRGEWREAADQFGTAIARDSTFALAYAALANAYGWTDAHGTPAALRMFDLGARHVSRLPVRERRLFLTAQAFSRGEVSSSDSALAYVRAYPDDLDGWLLLGETRFHGRAIVAATVTDLLAPFDTLVARDPNYVPAYVHPIELATELGDTVRLARYVAAYASRAPLALAARARRVQRAVTGTPDTLEHVVQALAEDRSAQALLVALLAAPARRSPAHEAGATAGLRRSVESARSVPDVLPNRAYVLARFLAGSARHDSAAAVLADLQRMPQADNAAFSTALAISMAAPAAGRFGAIADSMLAGISSTSPLLELLRAERAFARGDTALAQRLSRRLAADTTLPREVSGQATGVLGMLALRAGDVATGLTLLDDGLGRSGLRAYPLTSAPLRFARAQALLSHGGTTDARGRQLLRTGFTDDLEYISPVRRLLRDPADSVWLRAR